METITIVFEKPNLDLILEPFKVPIKVFITDNIKEDFERLGLISNRILQSTTGIFTKIVTDDIEYHLLALKDGDVDILNTIIHEISHAVHKISNDIGLIWSIESDEYYSYSLANLITETYQFYLKNSTK